MKKEDIADLTYTPTLIEIKTKTIYARILTKSGMEDGNFTKMWRGDLGALFEMYDRSFFDGFFMQNYRDRLFFRLSQRMTKIGGMTKFNRTDGTYEISLAIDLIFQTFHDVDREINVNGIECGDRLEAAMRILEHEIIHLLEFVLFGNSSCSQPRFSRLSHNIFGHTGVTHQLVTREERAHKKFNLKVGDAVSFDLDEKSYRGIIERITKRATVMVRDPGGDYRDSQGRNYAKYYVPLGQLRPARSKRGKLG